MNSRKELKKTIVYMLLHLSLLIILLISFSSCTLQTREVVVERKVPDTTHRSHKYLECISKLSREGIKQSLIEKLCNQAIGSIARSASQNVIYTRK